MLGRCATFACTVAAITGFAASPAIAQKAADKLRVAVTEPFQSTSPYFYPATEANFFNRSVYQNLIGYDEGKGRYVPIVAKSWKRIDDKTLEFELFDDIKFDNGEPLTADDVVYTYSVAADPKVKFAFAGKQNFTWMTRIEKIVPTPSASAATD
jgi:peptide/nickel transport system substrate-binding protein